MSMVPEDVKKTIPIEDPSPPRRKHLVDALWRFLNDRASLAELSGVRRDDLLRLAEAGHVRYTHGRLKEAEQIFQGLIVLDHRNAYFHSMMAAVHQKSGRPVEAIMEYTQATKLNQMDVSSFVNRGEIYLRHKNYRKAAEDFRRAIQLDPQGTNLWSNRARSLVIAIKRSLEADQRSPIRR